MTAARTGDVIGATWGEIKLEAKTWTIPAERYKTGKEHVIQLSDAAIALLTGLKSNRNADAYVFPGATGKPLSNMAMLELLRGMDANGYTPHGMRSSFSNWGHRDFDHETVELCLGHVVGNKVSQAYWRDTVMPKCGRCWQAWANYLGNVHAAENVVKLHG